MIGDPGFELDQEIGDNPEEEEKDEDEEGGEDEGPGEDEDQEPVEESELSYPKQPRRPIKISSDLKSEDGGNYDDEGGQILKPIKEDSESQNDRESD